MRATIEVRVTLRDKDKVIDVVRVLDRDTFNRVDKNEQWLAMYFGDALKGVLAAEREQV